MYSILVNLQNSVMDEIAAKMVNNIPTSEISHVSLENLRKLYKALDDAIADLT